jgi:hypothetical protein
MAPLSAAAAVFWSACFCASFLKWQLHGDYITCQGLHATIKALLLMLLG